jgi:hypothetical protein
MNRNWLTKFSPLLVLLATLTVSHLAYAHPHGFRDPGLDGGKDKDPDGDGGGKPHSDPVGAPELDLRLAIEGLALAGGAAALVWERMRGRR